MLIECSQIIWIWHSFQGISWFRCSMKAHWKWNQQCILRCKCSLCSPLSLSLVLSAYGEFFYCLMSPNTRFVHQNPQICWSFVRWGPPYLQTWRCRAIFCWEYHSHELDHNRNSTSWLMGSRTISYCWLLAERRECWLIRHLRRICCICHYYDRFFGDFYRLHTKFCPHHGTGWWYSFRQSLVGSD